MGYYIGRGEGGGFGLGDGFVRADFDSARFAVGSLLYGIIVVSCLGIIGGEHS